MLERLQEGAENINHEAVSLGHGFTNGVVDNGVEDDGLVAIQFGCLVDPCDDFGRLFEIINVRNRNSLEMNFFELGK